MDPASLLQVVTPVVQATILYLRERGLKKASDKAVETVGTKAGEGLSNISKRAFTTLQNWFDKEEDNKAKGVLEMVELDPHDDDFAQKLVTETTRVAEVNPKFMAELRLLADELTSEPNNIAQVYNNYAPNKGVQGAVNSSITINNTLRDE